ncbi:hypothetical protein F7P69_12685 [Cellulosimicrobium funkei]|nr:hypothetical protein [Cellulosimicrobium funkei]
MNSQDDENVEATAQHGDQVVAEIPGLARAFGQDAVPQLREVSCTSSPDPEMASRNTRWRAATGATVSSDQEARELADAVRKHAESKGWVTQRSDASHPSLERLYMATLDDLTLTINANNRGGSPEVTLAVVSPCLEKPDGHTMTRSEFDSMYGSSDPLYPNDDRSKFTNGEPKPLPESSDGSTAADH